MKAGSDPLNNLDKPGFVVKIYTAAEIEFASEIGKSIRCKGFRLHQLGQCGFTSPTAPATTSRWLLRHAAAAERRTSSALCKCPDRSGLA